MNLVLKSSLSWIDNNKDAREKVFGLLSQFNEKDSRDELGIGSIRDRISDLLFPGTSTIQTRLRYFFFVPWLYQKAEKPSLGERKSEEVIDDLERDLIETLMQSDDLDGVFGKTSGKELKRLPSSVYWSGLEKWGIKKEFCSQSEYFDRAKFLSAKRLELEKEIAHSQKHQDDCTEIQIQQNNASIWDINIPKAPQDFPHSANLKLTNEEATFIKDQLRKHCGESLLAYLADHTEYKSSKEISAPWDHPEFEQFDIDTQQLLHHAEFFAILIHGAYLLYNMLLAQLSNDEKATQNYEDQLCAWYAELQHRDSKKFRLDNWSLDEFWSTIESSKVSYVEPIMINRMTKNFIETWFNILQRKEPDFYKSKEVIILIREREKRLKGARSRFSNKKALEQWGGASGVNELRYRWSTAKQFLKDLSVAGDN